MFIVPNTFHFSSNGSISSDIEGIRIKAGAPGYAMWGPYIALDAGIYRFRPKIGRPSPRLLAEKARFDVYLNHRIVLDGELTDGLEFIARIPDTPGFEFRLKSVEEDLLFQGLDIEPVLLDRQKADTQAVVDLAAELIAKDVGAAVVLSLRDRLIGLGKFEQAGAVEQVYAARLRKKAAGIVQRNQALEIKHPGKTVKQAGDIAVVDLMALDEAGQVALQRIGCIPEFLEMTCLSRMPKTPGRAWQKMPGQVSNEVERRSLLDMYQSEADFGFQDDIVQEGGLTAYCPWTGEKLISRHGLIEYCFSIPYVFYHFEGLKTFYLCVGGNLGTRMLLYIPDENLIVHFEEIAARWYDVTVLVKSFDRKLVANAEAVEAYLKVPTRPAVIHGHNNMGHFCWNDLAGLQHAGEVGILRHVEESVELHRQFFPVRSLFPELDQKPTAFFNDSDAAFRHGISRNLMPVRFTNAHISHVLAGRMEATARSLASARGQVPEDLTGPLLWINLRAHNKVWINQAVHYAMIFNTLFEDYGMLAVFLDGLGDCKDVVASIKGGLKPGIRLFDGTGLPLLDSVNWAYAADAYVSPIGSGLVLANWLANKPGVAHAEHAHMDQLKWWNTVREGGVPPSAPELSDIRDVGTGIYCNYELDGSIVLALLRSALDKKFARMKQRE